MSQYVNISILEGSIMTILKYEGLSKDTSYLKQSSTVLKQRLYCVYFMNESVFINTQNTDLQYSVTILKLTLQVDVCRNKCLSVECTFVKRKVSAIWIWMYIC